MPINETLYGLEPDHHFSKSAAEFCMKTTCIFLIMFAVLLSKSNALRSLRGRTAFSSLLTPSVLRRPEQHFASFMSKHKGSIIGTGTKDIQENIFNNENMEERIENAEKWVTYQLSDTATHKLNKALGIEAEILDAVKQGERVQEKLKKSTIDKIKGLEFSKESVRMKGFMQQNPSICPGCGTPFQSRTPDHPGILHYHTILYVPYIILYTLYYMILYYISSILYSTLSFYIIYYTTSHNILYYIFYLI